MQEEEMEVPIKVVVVGDGAVGKSSMIQRYCKGKFTSKYKKTIGVDFLERQIKVRGQDCRLMVWDTAGQEEFDAITKAYYRGAQVCIVAFSTVDRDSFLAVEKWRSKVEAEVSGVVMCVVQNKIDLIDESCMTPDEVVQLTKKLKLKLFRTSVKENFNVEQVFEYLASKYLERRQREKQDLNNQKFLTNSIGMSLDSHSLEPKATASLSVSVGNGEQPFQIKPTKPCPKRRKPLMCIV